MKNLLSTEPVRLYSIAVALIALVAYFVPSGGWPLVLGLAAAVLGVGQGVRSQVWSSASHEVALRLARLNGALPSPDPVSTTGAPGVEVAITRRVKADIGSHRVDLDKGTWSVPPEVAAVLIESGSAEPLEGDAGQAWVWPLAVIALLVILILVATGRL